MAEDTKRTIWQKVWIAVRIIWGLVFNVSFYLVIIVAAIRLCSVAYDFSYQIFGNRTVDAAPGEPIVVTIEPGESTMEIASELEELGIVVNRYSFYIRAKLTTTTDSPILSGMFLLNTAMTYDDVLTVVTDISNDITPKDEKEEENEKAGDKVSALESDEKL